MSTKGFRVLSEEHAELGEGREVTVHSREGSLKLLLVTPVALQVDLPKFQSHLKKQSLRSRSNLHLLMTLPGMLKLANYFAMLHTWLETLCSPTPAKLLRSYSEEQSARE